ncbi:uncharacterized protein TRIADDRAFT_54458 [Trichoplax adhaerens]|uniref:Speckle targeted PIP5K1A-regulated poly(A) polymerase n=1 Tax=Trichoplax adhaerens TaxID=10228 RepID=B3RS34_TRIAD|nr:hypothetical protein TRIADDRAFT_54458 [Trichoplax adhaerens]EDV26984.1 hypothetical protein TRIADDRAFT_54458 [Trichoplax adhaerens]|eukprot:XP_002110980.1 hypothetical protein TRIADDRAFT_54458 [Trichoplax adhaerens]
MASVCEICGVKLESESSKAAHYQGRKHRRLAQEIRRRQEVAKRSIFVRNFNQCTDLADEFRSFFGKYGEIVAVHSDKEKVVLLKDIRIISIVFKSLPVFAIIEFLKEESAKEVLRISQSLPEFHGRKLVIKERTADIIKGNVQKKSKEQKKVKKSLQQLSNELLERLQIDDSDTLEQQLISVMQQRELTDNDNRLRRLVCDLLQQCFVELDESVKIVPFGSAVNGFGQASGDLDIAMIMDENAITDKGFCETSTDINIEDEKVTIRRPWSTFSVVAKFIKECIPGCLDVIALSNAREPVIKFKYNECSLCCDLTINNRLGIANSQLLQEYSKLDPRVKPLVFTIRTWAYCRGITLNSGGQFTSYSLILMIIYFLQCTKPSVLPSLQTLFREQNRLILTFSYVWLISVMTGIWDCSFLSCKNATTVFKTVSIEATPSLLHKFFCFYATLFDYDQCVISVKNGLPVTFDEIVRDIAGNDVLVKAMKNFKTTPICVQDPLLLNHNTTQNVNKDGLHRFQREARVAMNNCIKILTAQSAAKDSFSRANITLKELFSPAKYKDLLAKNSFVLSVVDNFNYLSDALSDTSRLLECEDKASKQYLLTVINYFYLLKRLKVELDVDCIYNREIIKYLRHSLLTDSANGTTISVIVTEIEKLFDSKNLTCIDSCVSQPDCRDEDILVHPPAKKAKVEYEEKVIVERKFPRLFAHCKANRNTWTGRRQKRRLQERLTTSEAYFKEQPHEETVDDEKNFDIHAKEDEVDKSDGIKCLNEKEASLFSFTVMVESRQKDTMEIIAQFDLMEWESVQSFQSFYAYIKKLLQLNC